MRVWTFLAALNGLFAVAFGAYAAHGLNASVAPLAERASQYELIHAVALLAVQPLTAAGSRLAALAGGLFVAGIALFSGSLYYKALVGPLPVPMVTPAGGILLLLAWLVLAASAVTRK